MEQILIYLAVAFIAVLLVVLGITFNKLNKVRMNYKIMYSGALRNKELIDKANERLSEYEKTKVFHINKINELEEEVEKYATTLVDYEMKNIKLQGNIDDQTDFISSLNERVQKAEAERDKLQHSRKALQESLRNYLDECEKLQSKLSRKGLGKKGRKKKEQHIGGGEYFANNSDNTISIGIDLAKENSYFSQITEVPFEEQKYVEITSEEQLREYNGCKFQADMFIDQIESHIEGVVFNNDATTLILHNNEYAGWALNSFESELCNNKYNYGWSVFDGDFGRKIKSLKILL